MQDRLEGTLEAVALLRGGDVEGLEELGPEAASDPEDDAPARDLLEHADLLGDVKGMANGKQVRGGAETELLTARRGCRQEQERRRERSALQEVALG